MFKILNASLPARLRRSLPVCVLVAVWMIATLPWLLGGKTIPFDAKDYAFHGVLFTAQSLLRGEAPFWNPYLFSGYPSFANPQTMTFTPTVILPMLLSQSVVWFDTVILVHLLLGGIGVLYLGRSYGWSNRGSLVAALIFMFGGVASSRLQHTPMIVVWTFVPWMFVALRALFAKPSLIAAAGAGAAVGLASLQLTQVTYLALVAVCAYGIFRLIDTARAEGMRAAFKVAGLLGLAGLLSLLIAAPQIIGTLSLLPHTNRADIDLVLATRDNSLSPLAYATLVSPDVLGNLSGPYIGPNDITETYLYVGAFPFAVLLFSLFGGKQRLALGERWFWTVLAAFSIFYMVGRATPVYSWLYSYLPGVRLFRRPTDAAFLFLFCAVVLIGAAIDPARAAEDADASRRTRAGPVLLIVCLLVLAALSFRAWFGTALSWVSLVALIAGSFCYLLVRAGPHSGAWFAAMALAICIDLGFHNVANRMNAHPLVWILPSISIEHNGFMKFLAQRLREDGLFRVELRTGAFGANAAESMRVPSIAGLDPFVLQDYVVFTGTDPNPAVSRKATGAFDSYHGKLNDLLGVRYLAANGTFLAEIKDKLGPAYHVVADRDGYVVWENQRVLPRLLKPERILPAPALSAFTPDTLNALDLERVAYVEAPSNVLARCDGGRVTSAEISRYANNEVVVAAETDRAAWIVLNDVYFDWWRGEVSGVSTPIYRANGMFRAICVPPGRHVVRFLFEPYRVFAGRWLAALPHSNSASR